MKFFDNAQRRFCERRINPIIKMGFGLLDIFSLRKAQMVLAAVMLLGGSTFSYANTDVEVGVYPANITRTAWEMIRSDNVVTLGSNLTSRDDVAAYDFVESPLPLLDDARWQLAPDQEIIGFAEVSRLNGTDGNNGCKSAVDYSYFQTVVNVPFGVEVSEFNIHFSGIDDDARVSIYNSKHQGLLIPGGFDGSDTAQNNDGYVHLDNHNQYPAGQNINLLSYVASGENRIVVTQVDNCPATDLGNLLQSAVVTLDGIEVITAESFLFQAITSAGSDPTQDNIITILARIYGDAGDTIPTLEVVSSKSCEGGVLGGDTDGDGLADGSINIFGDLILNDNSFNLLGGDVLDEHGDAFLKGTVFNADYDPLRDIYFAVRVKSDSGAVVGVLSSCVVAGPDNDSWVRAAPITLIDEVSTARSSGNVNGFIDIPGIARWYKFTIKPGARAIIELSSLPDDYDIAVFKDITQSFVALAGASDTDGLNRIGAEFAPSMFSPSMFSPSMFSPSMFSPSMFSPSMFSPSMFSPSMFSPSMFSPSMFSPSMFSPSMFSPSMFSPSMFSPSMFSADEYSPSMFSPSMFSEDNYANAQIRSLISVSAQAGTVSERVIADTWNNTGEFYIRITGKNGVYDIENKFQLSVNLDGLDCNGVDPDLGKIVDADGNKSYPAIGATNGGYNTIILWDSAKLAAAGNLDGDITNLGSKLQQLADLNLAGINGIVVDLAAAEFTHIQDLHAQADLYIEGVVDNTSCPFAENLTAKAIKTVIDAYRDAGNPLRYVVIAGADDVIPFFRYPDQGMLGPEQNYEPPMRDATQSQSSLRLNYILGQGEYGSSTLLSRNNGQFPVPGLAVGRLVETASEMTTVIQAYLDNGGKINPTSTLVTGYDFLTDVAEAIQGEFVEGTSNARNDTLITDADVAPDAVCVGDPNNRCSWTADQLTHELLDPADGGEDLIFLAGHFSANSALAADYQSATFVTQLTSSAVDLTNSLVFSAGCHSGYSVVDNDIVEGLTIDTDWAQAFAQKGATLIAGTGYQYGDTDFIEYSEKLYLLLAKELRTGTGAVSVGEALVKAKQKYLSTTPDIRGLHRKSLLISTLFGLPMLSIDMPGTRILSDTGSSLTAIPVTAKPGFDLGLATVDLPLTFNLIPHTVELSTIENCASTDIHLCPTVTATYLSGADNIISNPAEPALPLRTVDVSVDNMSLRGVGLRGGSWLESTVTPFTGAPTTELRGVHTPFSSLVNFPMQLATPNYYGAITETGGTSLHVTPAQHRVDVADLGTNDATLRQFSDMQFRLFYSNDTGIHGDNQPALVGPPSMTRVKAVSDGINVTFFVNVVGAPSAGIQEVWVTHTDGLLTEGVWQSLDLVQNEFDTTLWTGFLPDGALNGRLDFMVQSVNGVGLVSLDDNYGSYYHLINSGDGPSTLSLTSVHSQLSFGDTLDELSARLTSIDEFGGIVPVTESPVLFTIGAVTRLAWTDLEGVASVELPLNMTPPDEHRLNAYFPGNESLQPANAEQTFIITKVDTVLSLSEPQTVRIDDVGYTITAALKDFHGNPLLQYTVYFTITGGADGDITVPVITDITGLATLNAEDLQLPIGSYTVTARFLGSIPVGDSSHFVDSPLYNPTSEFQSFTITKQDTILKVAGPLTVRADSLVNGFTATLTDNNGMALSGRSVSFSVGSITAAAMTDAEGFASFDTNVKLPAGSYTVTADYLGDSSTYNPSNDSQVLTVTMVDTSLTISGPLTVRADENVSGFSATLTDDNGNGLGGVSVTFTVGTTTEIVTTNVSGVASLSALSLPAGDYTVSATFDGDTTTYTSASVSKPFSVTIVQTSLTIAGPLTVRADENVSGFSATLTDDNGKGLGGVSVTFTVGTTTEIVTTGTFGVANLSALSLPAGDYTVSATFDGDTTTYTSASASKPFSVTIVQTSLMIAGPLTVRADENVSGFSATLTDDNGKGLSGVSVTFTVGTTTEIVTTGTFGVANLSALSLPAGDYTVSATFDGDTTTYTSASASKPFSVTIVNTSLAVTGPLTVRADEDVAGFTARLTDDKGINLAGRPITFSIGSFTEVAYTDGAGVATLSALTLPAGSYQVTADFSGDITKYRASFGYQNFEVTLVNTQLTVSGPLSLRTDETVSGFTATLTDDEGMALSERSVTFSIGTTTLSVNTDSFGVASFDTNVQLPAGSYTVTAVFNGDSIKYHPSGDYLDFTVGKVDTILSLATGSQIVGIEGVDSAVTATLTDDNGMALGGVPVTFTVDDITRTVNTDNSGNAELGEIALPAGTYTVTANYAGDSIYNANTTSTTLVLGAGNNCPTSDTKGKITITGFCYLNYTVDGKVAITDGTIIINGFVDQKVEQFGTGSVRITESGIVRGAVIETGPGEVEVFGTIGDSGKVGGQINETGGGDVIVHVGGVVYGNTSEEDDGSIIIGGTIEGNVFESGNGSIELLSGGIVTGGLQQD